MDKPTFTNFNIQSPVVTAFLGGITFTALVLFMQPNSLKLIHILIPLTAGVSFLFIVATFGMMKAPTPQGSVHYSFFNMNVGFFACGFIGLMVIIPMMVYSFTERGAYLLSIFEAVIIGVFFIVGKKNPK